MHVVKGRHIAVISMDENFYNALSWTNCVAY